MLIVFLFIIGLSIGSFLNVVIDRIPQGKSIVTGRSACDFCHHPLAWYDLFPVVSYVFLRGACRYCKRKLSWQYPLVEFVIGISLVVFFVFLNPQTSRDYLLSTIYYLLFVIGFALAVMDIKYQILSDNLLILFFFLSLALLGIQRMSVVPLHMGIGFLAAFPFFLLFVISKGRAMGFGDVKLAFCLGFLLGSNVIIAFYIACITGAVGGVALLILKKKNFHTATIAFGPFLLLGALLVTVWGDLFWKITKSLLGI